MDTTTILLGAFATTVALLGAAIGSFLNVVIWRVPEGMSLVSPPSHCPKCGARIRWFDNIPIFGWIFLGGKCRDCRAPISPRYPIVEAFCFLVSAVVAAGIFFGGWTGFDSQALRWDELARWSDAWAVARAELEASDAGASELESGAGAGTVSGAAVYATSFSPEELISLVRSAAALALAWSFAAFAALTLGFVEWDKAGKVPATLVSTAAAIPVLGLLLIGAIGDDFPTRAGAFAASVLFGALGTLPFVAGLSKSERVEQAIVGALWGFCAGCVAAFPGAFALAAVAFVVRRKSNRRILGLATFGATALFFIAEAAWFAFRG